jgi:hypothetical protein
MTIIKSGQSCKDMKIQKADMYEIIKKYVIGQNVLDVGCVGSVKEKTYIEKKKI